jgi:phage tail sheath protein FI
MDTAGKAPGVYVQPIDAVGPIVGVGTSTVAMIGKAARLATGVKKGMPRAVTSWTVYRTLFGEFDSSLSLPYAVRGFFENGGSFLYVIPVDATDDLTGPIDQLTRTPEVNIVCVPGATDVTAQNLLIEHCAAARNRFAILDGAAQSGAANGAAASPVDADSALLTTVRQLSKSEFAGVYWPWIVVDDPAAPAGATERTKHVAPSGHIAGIMARSDARYGVHKAPANEEVRGALDLEYPVNATEQGILNDERVNVIRHFAGRPPVLWGARTLSVETAWRYVNVRRLVSYVEQSLTTGLGWALFQANTTSLWKSLERTISEFLDRIWQAGALFGRTAEQAYYVRIDEELNPRDARRQGQVFIEIGIAPVEPAEFVIVRLGLLDGSQPGRG